MKAKKYTVRVQRDPIRSYTAFNLNEIWFEDSGIGYIFNEEGYAFKSEKPRNDDNEEIEISSMDALIITEYLDAKNELDKLDMFKKPDLSLEEKKEKHEKRYNEIIKNMELKMKNMYRGFEIILKETQFIEDFKCGSHNGYVVIPSEHKLYKTEYDMSDEIENLDCHGGITFSDFIEEDKWAIGFDTCHLGDTRENCDKEFVIKECEKIIDQLIENGELK